VFDKTETTSVIYATEIKNNVALESFSILSPRKKFLVIRKSSLVDNFSLLSGLVKQRYSSLLRIEEESYI